MNDRELAVNRALQALDDARRHGQLAIPDYRQQRRELLLRLETAAPAPATPAVPAVPRLGPGLRIAAGLVALVALGALSWCLSR